MSSNEEIVRRVCNAVGAAQKESAAVTAEQQCVYDVDYLIMEANSGASFEQYFRWASSEEIGRVVAALNNVGLKDLASLTERAIAVAFPQGIPPNADKSDITDSWSEEQNEQLGEMFQDLEAQNDDVTNALAAFIQRVGA